MNSNSSSKKNELKKPLRYATCTSCSHYSEEFGNWIGISPVCLYPKGGYQEESYGKLKSGALCHTIPERCTSALNCDRYNGAYDYTLRWKVCSDEKFYKGKEGSNYLKNLGYEQLNDDDSTVIVKTVSEWAVS